MTLKNRFVLVNQIHTMSQSNCFQNEKFVQSGFFSESNTFTLLCNCVIKDCQSEINQCSADLTTRYGYTSKIDIMSLSAVFYKMLVIIYSLSYPE